MGILKTLKRKILNINYKLSNNLKFPKNKNIIVTGANSGIGFQLTKILSINDNNLFAFINFNDDKILNLKKKILKLQNVIFLILKI